MISMKTTLNINDRLLAQAKALAAIEQGTLTRLVEEGLQLRLAQRRHQAKRASPLPVFGSGGLCQDLDGLSNRALLDAADADR